MQLGRGSLLLLMAASCSLASYDEFLSCDTGDNTRAARAMEVHAAIMEHCDLGRQSYCHHKGRAYPERAITRFLAENLGLMRRMGGELDSREVQREMRSTSWLVQNSHHREEEEQEKERDEKTGSFSLGLMPPGENMFSGLSGLNINGQQYLLKQGSGLAMVKNAQDEGVQSRTEPEPPMLQTVFRETTKRPSPGRSTSESVTTSSSQTTVRVSSSQSSSSSPATATTVPTTPSISPSMVTTEVPSTTTDMETLETTWKFPEQETTPPVQEYEDYEEYGSEYNQDQEYNLEEVNGAEPLVAVSQEPAQEEQESVYLDLTGYELTGYQDDLQQLNPGDLEYILDSDSEDPISKEGPVIETVEQEVEEVMEELEPDITYKQEDEITYFGDPINACDVDTTIEAPYWANNTGGKTLALLNLYPFEQYIHIETCQAEMSEGLCRPGCRCEQQYRLHRLLAFDPNNECRGIFSDWFSFPSFCLCKCYGAREVLKGTRDPKKSDFSPAVQASHRLGPGPTHNRDSEESFKVGAARESKDSKLSNHRLSHVPAVFPYEGRAALFAELQQYSDQEFEAAKMLGSSAPGHNSVDSLDTVETLWSLGSHGGHMDNTVESDQVHSQKKRKQGRGLEPDNFFYNQPIMDFALPDGTVGTLKQTPRK